MPFSGCGISPIRLGKLLCQNKFKMTCVGVAHINAIPTQPVKKCCSKGAIQRAARVNTTMIPMLPDSRVDESDWFAA